VSERTTQRARVLGCLLAAHGQEVPSVELSHISLQYGARVLELRRMGIRITSRTERRDGCVHGFFRLELGTDGAKSMPTESPSPPQPAQATLFDLPPRPLNYPD